MVDFMGQLLVALIFIAGTSYFWFFFHNKQQEKKKAKDTTVVVVEKEEETSTTTKDKNNNKNKKKSNQSSTTTSTTVPSPTKHPRFVRRFGGHSDIIVSMAVSPNGEYMATTGKDGILRIVQVTKGSTFHVQCKVPSTDSDGIYQPTLKDISWCHDNRTIIGTLHQSHNIVMFRIRKKKEIMDPKHPYEIVELMKRRFKTSSKFQEGEEMDTVVVDSGHSNYTLILTSSTDIEQNSHPNMIAWNGETGQCVGSLSIPSGKVRLSADGKFVTGRVQGIASQVKLYDIIRKKVKGDIEPMFEKISTKACMTLIANSQKEGKGKGKGGGGSKIVDIDFMNLSSSSSSSSSSQQGSDTATTTMVECCDKAVIACMDGTLQVWDLNVDYKQREDPKLLCTCTALVDDDDNTQSYSPIVLLSATGGNSNHCIAVITKDTALHVFSYTTSPNPQLSLHCTIPNTHAEGVGDVQCCSQSSSKFVYTRGAFSKDVFCWNVE